MSVRLRSVGRAEWERDVQRFRDHGVRQTWAYSTSIAARQGATSEHVAIVDGDTVLGLAEVRIKRVPVLRAGVAYISGGPLVRNGHEDAQRLGRCLEALRQEFVAERGLVLRITPATGPSVWVEEHRRALESSGFCKGEQPDDYRTIVIDLSPPLDQLRRRLDQKWRNCLNKSEKAGLVIRSSEDGSLFPAFIGLFDELIGRKGFSVRLDPTFYEQVQRELPPCERLRVSLAEIDGAAVAGHVASLLGDTCVYLLGATSQKGREVNASYLLQWDVVQFAKSRGATWYDLGGIDPDANPGVHKFKTGMGGAELIVSAPFECTPGGLQAWLTRVSERAYRRIHSRLGQRLARGAKN